MRESTLVLIVLIKFAELIFLTLVTASLYPAAAQLIYQLDGRAPHISLMALGALLIVSYHLFYNTLVTNLRFRCKLKCSYTLGKCCFDGLNYMMCACWLKKLCDEKKQIWFVVKWLLQLGYLITLILMVRNFK